MLVWSNEHLISTTQLLTVVENLKYNMPTQQVCLWAGNAGVGVSQWAAEPMGIWQEKGASTTQRKDNKVSECVWEIGQSMSISNKLGTSLKQWYLLIDHCVVQISDLAPKKPRWKRYKADKTILHGQKLKAVLDKFAEVGLYRRKNRIDDTPTKKRKFVHVDTEDDKKETLGHKSLPIKARCDASTDYLVQPLSFTIAYMDSNVTGKRMGENNTQLFSSHRPGNDESILWIVTSIIDTTILLIVNAAIAGLPDASRPNTCNVTPIFDNNTVAGWTPMRGGRSYLPVDDILPPPADNMIDNIGEKSDDDAEMQHPNPRSFLTTKTGFQKFERKLQ
ncbi:hypothetical protein BDD12DRAFT_872549 [Trichophaea hybrida]|nr:hypothetical protein BDD12DRAFT_872549 [Trichophaea hybrida]